MRNAKITYLLPVLMICGQIVSGQVRRMIQKAPTNDPPATIQIASAIKKLNYPTVFLVLGKKKFADAIQPFIDHKNAMGLPTAFVDLESLSNYPGADEPEKIKRAIADASLTKATQYVMLVGDASVFPVRHRYVSTGNELGRTSDHKLNSGWWYDGGYCATDHYYANLFHHKDGELSLDFDNWDADGNGKYNEQVWQFQNHGDDQPMNTVTYNPDNVDGYPDIVVARVPVHDETQLTHYVNKVIRYETSNFPKNTGIGFIAGASYPGSVSLANEVCYYNNYALQLYVGEPNLNRMLFNAKEIPFGPWEPANFATIRNAALKRWALVYVGHGYNLGWDIRDNDTCYFDDSGNAHWMGNRPGNFDDGQVNMMQNKMNLPVVFSLGCETGQLKPTVPTHEYIDVNGINKWYWDDSKRIFDSISHTEYTQFPITISKPSPYDLNYKSNRTFACSWLCNNNEAGAIAFFGETVVCENYHAKDLIERVLYSYTKGKKRLGDIWLEGQRQYWRDFKTNTNVFHNPRIYLSIMTFYGDPTLVIQ